MKKISRKFPIFDECNTSMEILYQRIKKYFDQEKPEQDVFFTDYFRDSNTSWEERRDLLNVITFGDTPRKIFQSGNLVHEKIQLWNISTSFQKIQNEILFKGASYSELIPRYKIFKKEKSYSPDLNKALDLVYAGRLSYQKNIPFLLFLTSELNKLGIRCNLHLFGDFDERFHENFGRWKNPDLKTLLKDIEKDLGSNTNIKYHGRVGPEDWLNYDYEQPVAISVSTYIGEDFGVSLAQAQEKGWPVICSHFGGHQDIESNNMFSLSCHLVGHSHLPLCFQRELAKLAAKNFMSNGFKENSPIGGPYLGKEISLEELDSFRRNLITEVGTSVFWLNREGIEDFADTNSGALFLQKCMTILEGTDSSLKNHVALILSGTSRVEINANEEKFIREHFKKLNSNSKVSLFFSEELSYPDKIRLLKTCNIGHVEESADKKTKEFIKQLF